MVIHVIPCVLAVAIQGIKSFIGILNMVIHVIPRVLAVAIQGVCEHRAQHQGPRKQ